MSNIKVFNKTNHAVGIKLINGVERNLAPKSMTVLNEDEVQVLAATTKLFSDKHLTIEDETALENVGLTKENTAFETDEEVLTKLQKLSAPKLTAYLNDITEKHLQLRVISIAKTNMDKLPASKINIINSAYNVDLNIEAD